MWEIWGEVKLTFFIELYKHHTSACIEMSLGIGHKCNAEMSNMNIIPQITGLENKQNTAESMLGNFRLICTEVTLKSFLPLI